MTSKKPVLVHIVQHLAPGGIETLCLELIRNSVHQDSHIISLEGSFAQMAGEWQRLHGLKSRLHFLGKPQGRSLATVWSLRQLLKQLGADMVQTHHIGPLLYGGLAAKLARVKLHIHTEHDAWHLDNPHHQRLVRQALRLFRPVLVADAQIVARSIRSRIRGARPRVIPNGIDINTFRPGDKKTARRTLGLPEEVRLIGCAARMQHVKGHDVLLDALFRLPPNVHLALAGTGPEESVLRQQVKDLGLGKRVHFLGLVEQMPAFYQAIDLFCLASRAEGLPLSPLEAQACGTPCVLTDVGGSSESLCRQTGQLVQALDSQKLGMALSVVLKRPLLGSPRDFVVKGHSIESMLGAYEKLMIKESV